LLAGLPQQPTEYDPFVNPQDAKIRQVYVLDQMAKLDMITADEAAAAKAEQVNIRQYSVKIQAPHFVYYVKQYLEQLYGPNASDMGLQVYTSLDLDVQHKAEQVAKDRIEELKKQKATNAAIVIMRPGTGEILAMVGSVDYNNTAIDGQVNVATAERQPGSSFKPITYATAFKNGWSPATVILDTLTGFPNPGQKDYVPKNYDGKDHGYVTVRESLGNSLNIPAVKAIQFAGVQNTIDTAHDMGIKGLNRGLDWYGLSLTLGGGEVTLLDMTNAYSTFANQGTEVDANPILRIVDSQDRVINCNAAYACSAESQVQQNQFGSGNGQVLDPRISYMVTNILSDNKARTMEFGPNSPLRMSFPAAAKTGTTNDNRDSWTLGYTPDLTIGVWVGNSDNAEMLAVTGAIGAAVIWHNMMDTFYAEPSFVDLLRGPDGKTHRDFVQPEGLVKAWACSAKGDVNDLFLKGQVPKGCTTYKDPKGNKQLHSAPSTDKPKTKPTPMPGIVFPTPVP
jgi:membrane peptidoglycan carboxypeptidase